MTRPAADPVLASARREAIAVFVIWLAAMAYTITYCYRHGYGRRLEDLTYVLGFPDWVFWGVVAPWLVCVAVSYAFAFWFMTDQELGEDPDEATGGAEVDDA